MTKLMKKLLAALSVLPMLIGRYRPPRGETTMRGLLRPPSPALVVALAALLVAIGGSALAAVAAIPQDGRFTACYQTSAQVLDRIVVFAEPDEACPQTYARVTWSQTGGAAGPPGPQGPAGPTRPQGTPGPAGPAADSTSVRLAVTSAASFSAATPTQSSSARWAGRSGAARSFTTAIATRP